MNKIISKKGKYELEELYGGELRINNTEKGFIVATIPSDKSHIQLSSTVKNTEDLRDVYQLLKIAEEIK